ncbi:C-8 sterol isomerase [Dipodascopsis tothii]|uniref:C-8 sterol isomerase n=1 Tax=Dipodascopsis tothii TaxID=44089 RepID=UPI0034CE469D
MKLFSTTTAAVLAVLLAVYAYCDKYLLQSWFIFDRDYLQELVTKATTEHPNNATAIFQLISDGLVERYGETVNPYNTEDWVFNNAGGAMGSMFVLHSSISEYLIFFGTAVGTEGHTGVHMADDYFYILQGEQRVHRLGDPLPQIYKPGQMNHLTRGSVGQYMMPDTCWALELAQGWIPAMLPFGFADALSSTLDAKTLGYTVWLSASNIVKNLLRGKI